MIDFDLDTKCKIDYTTKFKSQLKKVLKQGKNSKELLDVVTKLANLQELEPKYRNHDLINDKTYRDCKECHIKPDWLLVYKYINNKLVLLLLATGSHSEILNKQLES